MALQTPLRNQARLPGTAGLPGWGLETLRAFFPAAFRLRGGTRRATCQSLCHAARPAVMVSAKLRESLSCRQDRSVRWPLWWQRQPLRESKHCICASPGRDSALSENRDRDYYSEMILSELGRRSLTLSAPFRLSA